jgi:hypothetical protein
LTAAREQAKQRVAIGRTNVDRYLTRKLAGLPATDTVVVPHDFFYTEQKKAQLFYQVPEVHLRAERPDAEQAAPLLAAVLNHKILSAKGVNAQGLMDGMVFDLICPAGFGACKIGYESTSTMVPMPVTDPTTGQPVVDPETGAPVSAVQPVVIAQRYFADRIPPGRLRLPPEWLGGDIDEAAWVGFDFMETTPHAARGSSMLQEWDDLLQSPAQAPSLRLESRRRVTEVWYRAALFDDTAHPDQVRLFQWAEGDPEPRVHENSPYQVALPNGRLGGMRGYPIGFMTIRTISDTAVPPSDVQITRNTVDELSRGRTQLLERRNRSLPQSFINTTKLGADVQAKIEQNINTAFIPIAQPLADGDVVPLDKGRFSRENFEFQDFAERDLDRAWALGANQTGATSRGARTATELQLIQANTDTRLDYERERIVSWFCDKLVPKLAALVQLFAGDQEFVEVLGPNGATRLIAWTKSEIQGDFTYLVQAGATLRHDAASERKRWLDFYNLTANDPFIRRQEVTRNLAKAWGMDPAALLQTPPPADPERPSISIAVKGEDLNPFAPQYANILLILQGAGVNGLAPAAPPAAPPAHPGPTPPAQPVNQHLLDLTAQLPGGGSIAANAARTQ